MVRKNYSKEIEIICLGSNELIKILKDDKSAGLVKYFFGEIDLITGLKIKMIVLSKALVLGIRQKLTWSLKFASILNFLVKIRNT